MDDKVKLTLKQLRLLAGFSQREVANELNLSIQSVIRWERGDSRPKDENIEKLASLYNVSILEITNSCKESKEDLKCVKLLKKLSETTKLAKEQADGLLEQSIKSYWLKNSKE